MSEHQEQATFFQFVRLNRKHAKHADLRAAMELCYAIPNGFYSKSPKVITDMKAEGLTKGILDVNLDWPVAKTKIVPIHELEVTDGFIGEKKIILCPGLRLEFKYRKPHESTIKTQEKMESGLYLVDLSKKQKEKRELLLKAGYEVKVVYLAVQAIRTVFEYLPFEVHHYQGIKEYL